MNFNAFDGPLRRAATAGSHVWAVAVKWLEVEQQTGVMTLSAKTRRTF
ncbi:hypothetical protein [Edaphobacter flagellatus]|nr:hypothetical protein [Edaphobacter flagellatus]